MRTEEERKAIVAKCVRIEKEGGDVLAYLKTKGYIYTPGSTWRNFQKQYLHRSDEAITSGKPGEAR